MKICPAKAVLLATAFSLATSFSIAIHAQTLHDVVQETVATNPDIQITAKVKRASNEQVNQARAGYLPTLNVTAGFGREHSENRFNTTIGDTTKSNLWRRELGVELRQNVFHGFDTWYEMKRTKAKTDADSYLVCAAAEDQALLATKAYINVLRDRELVEIARRNLRSHQGFQTMIKQRGDAGVGREADVHQVNGRLALAKSNLAAIENDLANSEAMYFRVTGVHPRDLETPATPGSPLIPRTLDEAANIALRFHPKMRSAVVDVEEARAQHNVSHRTAFPVLDVVAAAQNDRDINGIEGPDNSYRIMGELHYNLFNGGADIARQRETAYLTQEAAEVRNRTCRQVIENLRLSWNAMQTSEERLPSLRVHSKASQNSLDSYTEQFKLNKRSLLDVLDTENERFAADTDFVRGCYDALYSRYRVVDAMGQLANFLKVTLPGEAREVYHTYQDIASPARSNRQYDAGLEQRDFPSRFYHRQEPIHKEQACTLSSAGVITRHFTGKPLGKAFDYKEKLQPVVDRRRGVVKAAKKSKVLAKSAPANLPEDSGKWQHTRNETPSSNTTVENVDTETLTKDLNESTVAIAKAKSAGKAETTAKVTNSETQAPAEAAAVTAVTPEAKSEQAEKSDVSREAKPTADKSKAKSWAVKVGSYTSEKDVEKSIAKLQDKGFDGYVKEIKTPDATTTEVYVGPTKQRSSAEQLYNKLMDSQISGNVVPVEDTEEK